MYLLEYRKFFHFAFPFTQCACPDWFPLRPLWQSSVSLGEKNKNSREQMNYSLEFFFSDSIFVMLCRSFVTLEDTDVFFDAERH